MRLPSLDRGDRWTEPLFHAFVRLVSGHPLADVSKTLRYRADHFGRPFSALLDEVMRGRSGWTAGQRELFAAWVAHENHCVF